MAFSIPSISSPNSVADPLLKTGIEGLNNVAASYRTLLSAQSPFKEALVAGTYALANGSQAVVSGGNFAGSPLPSLYFDDADNLIGGLTQKLRIRVQTLVNATKPTLKFTCGLYPVTVAGASNQIAVTLGTVVSGSTVEINEPAASTVTSAVGSDFTIPSDGQFVLGVMTSATLTANSALSISGQLQTRSV